MFVLVVFTTVFHGYTFWRVLVKLFHSVSVATIRQRRSKDATAAANEAAVMTCLTSSSAATKDTDRVELQVGEKVFFTTKSTLTRESAYFQSMFLGPWNDQRPDGSYYIDGDGETFSHILSYLRRGVFPVFYDRVHGHDEHKYHLVLEDARYYAIPALERWLDARGYISAVCVNRQAWITDSIDGDGYHAKLGDGSGSSLIHLELTPMAPKTVEVYVCPRDIVAHYGRPELCGRACHKAQEGFAIEYHEKIVSQTLAVRTQVSYDRGLCMDTDEMVRKIYGH